MTCTVACAAPTTSSSSTSAGPSPSPAPAPSSGPPPPAAPTPPPPTPTRSSRAVGVRGACLRPRPGRTNSLRDEAAVHVTAISAWLRRQVASCRIRPSHEAVTVHELSRLDARRIAVRAQLLDRSRPTELLDAVRQLTLLQIDPIAAIAPNADLVAWSRLGSSYSPAELDTALADRTLLELRAMIRPSEDLALYRGHGRLGAGRARGAARLAGVPARLGAGQRRVPSGHPRSAWLLGAAAVTRTSGHLQGPVAVDRLDQQPQRHATAGAHDAARRGRDRRAPGRRPAVGPGDPGLPR